MEEEVMALNNFVYYLFISRMDIDIVNRIYMASYLCLPAYFDLFNFEVHPYLIISEVMTDQIQHLI